MRNILMFLPVKNIYAYRAKEAEILRGYLNYPPRAKEKNNRKNRRKRV